MNRDTFNEAMRTAQRFVEACNRLAVTLTDNTGDWSWPISGTKETGAVKRASMDLSRALSAMLRAN